jgi:hypothetical protein
MIRLPPEVVSYSLDTTDKGGARSFAKRWYRWFAPRALLHKSAASTKSMRERAYSGLEWCKEHEDCRENPELARNCALRKVIGYASGKREHRVVTYTTAPASYDYTGFGAKDLGVVAHDSRGKPIRKVSNPEGGVEAQRGRYASGMHMAADETEWKKLVQYKLVTKVGKKAAGAVGGASGRVTVQDRKEFRAFCQNATTKQLAAIVQKEHAANRKVYENIALDVLRHKLEAR